MVMMISRGVMTQLTSDAGGARPRILKKVCEYDPSIVYRIVIHSEKDNYVDASFVGWVRNGAEQRFRVPTSYIDELVEKHNFAPIAQAG